MTREIHPLRVEFLDQLNSRPIAPTIRFENPPGGLLITYPPPIQTTLSMAQLRDSSAPSLLWEVRSNKESDQDVDQIFEDRQMGGDNA